VKFTKKKNGLQLTSKEGYSVWYYIFENGQAHFEAWPPAPGQGKTHHMLGKRKTANEAVALCNKHYQKPQSAA
jgi:hypothetical protein